MKRLLLPLTAVAALLGGCAIAPDYGYSGGASSGYYYGEAPYGGADTVIYQDSYGPYYDPWAFGGFWGSGYYGAGGVYYSRPVYRSHGGHGYHHYHGGGHRDHRRPHEARVDRRHARPHGDWNGHGRMTQPKRWHGSHESAPRGRATVRSRSAAPRSAPARVQRATRSSSSSRAKVPYRIDR